MSQVQVSTPATDDVLIRVQDVIDTLGLDIPATEAERDTEQNKQYQVLDRIVKGASTAVESYLGRILRKQSYIERVPGLDNQYLQLYHIPVAEVTSIHYGRIYGSEGSFDVSNEDNTEISTDSWSLLNPEAGLVYSIASWPLSTRLRVGLTDTILPNQPLPWYIVRYTAGYELAHSTTDYKYKLPWDIVEATIVTAKIWWQSAKTNPRLLMQKVDDLMVKYRFPSASGTPGISPLPPEVTGLLDPYTDIL